MLLIELFPYEFTNYYSEIKWNQGIKVVSPENMTWIRGKYVAELQKSYVKYRYSTGNLLTIFERPAVNLHIT